jgi:hypothetical protein
MGNISRSARLTVLAAIPPAGAAFGGLIDERLHLGFSIWRSACRAAGFSVASVISFTLQLLPNAIAGALLGALLVQAIAFSTRHREGSVDVCLAAHAGCTIAMPAGLILCALAMPVLLMLLAETALAIVAALGVLSLCKRNSLTPMPLHP